jgi:hypothetical protein
MAAVPFVIVPESVVDLSPTAIKVYCVLGKFASYDDARQCWPSIKTIADAAKCCVRTVQSALRVLREAGAIVVEERWDRNGEQGTNLYRLGTWDAPEPCSVDQGRVQDSADKREDQLLPQDQVLCVAGRAQAREEGAAVNESLPGLGEDWGPVEKVGRKPVTQHERELATAVVAEFNEQAGTRVSAETHGNMALVVGAIRDYPRLRLEHWRKVIARQLAAPWWDGPPVLRVIFSVKVLPMAIDQAREWDGGPVERPRRRGREAQSLDDLVAMADRLEAQEAAREGQ